MSERNVDIDERLDLLTRSYSTLTDEKPTEEQQVPQTSEPHNIPKSKPGFFLHALSWIVFYIAIIIITFAGYVLSALFIYALQWVSDTLPALYWLLVFTIGGLFLFLLCLPFFYGVPLAIKSSETICPSETGLRYKALSIVWIINSIISLITHNYTSLFAVLYMIAIAIAVLLMHKNCLGETLR